MERLLKTQGGSRMRLFRTYGSVRGVAGDCHSYRDQLISLPSVMKRGSMKTGHSVLSESTFSQPGSLIISGKAGKTG